MENTKQNEQDSQELKMIKEKIPLFTEQEESFWEHLLFQTRILEFAFLLFGLVLFVTSLLHFFGEQLVETMTALWSNFLAVEFAFKLMLFSLISIFIGLGVWLFKSLWRLR